MDASAKLQSVPKAHLDDPRFIEDYRRAYQVAWEVAWSGLRRDPTHRQPNKMEEWADEIAHRVALEFAGTQLSWR